MRKKEDDDVITQFRDSSGHHDLNIIYSICTYGKMLTILFILSSAYRNTTQDESRYNEDIFGITLRTAEVQNKSRRSALMQSKLGSHLAA